jgi:hypothetical protein
MNGNNQKDINYVPLKRIVDGLYDEEDNLVLDQVKESLEAKGFNPAEIVATVKKAVDEAVRVRRVQHWQDEARAKIAQMKSSRARVTTWSDKSEAEIEQAFAKVRAGTFGEGTTLLAKAAFRNYQDLTISEKASILDDLEALKSTEDHPKE